MKPLVHPYPESGLPRSGRWTLQVAGNDVPVFELETTRFAHFAAEGSAELRITADRPWAEVAVRPARAGIVHHVDGHSLVLELPAAVDLCIDVSGDKPLMLYADDPRASPRPEGEVVRLEPGKVHAIDQLDLHSGQTLFVEPGAILRGVVRAAHANNIAIVGRGMIDGGCTLASPLPKRKLVQLEDCQGVLVDGPLMIRPAGWMLALAACDDVIVRGVRQIGEIVTSDGVDVVGSRNVRISDCLLKNNDDCIAVKAIVGGDYAFADSDPARDVFNVRVERCIFWNDRAGNVMEIGFETRCDSIRDVVFRDIDVIAAHGYGGVFTIHNGDRAVVHDVLYEDIRVEHMYDRMVDFQVLHSRYSKDAERGRIRNVTLRRVRTLPDQYNTLNLIGGYDESHTVEGICFDDVRIGDVLVRGPDDLALFTRHAGNITYR
jgi:hypothetical protein